MKTSLLTGMLIGAGLMYLFDPEHGRSRRARLSDQAGRAARRTSDDVEDRIEDAANRGRGIIHEAEGRIHQGPASDETVTARVRSEIGHEISHPGAIQVTARNGRITLSGPILAGEVDKLIARVALVRGVTDVVNQLEVHREAGGVPGLQGSGRS